MRAIQPYLSGQAGDYVLRAVSQQFLSEHWQDGQCRVVPQVPGRASSSKPYPLSRCLSRRRRRR
ncbi:MAG TPA: hypothetical protein VGT44_00680 [Ktedonobacteraceae bacterium]|nr:hypothetical protein [Ktedonobacteraceae bacterium]